jgi:hypothetical protein
MSVLLLLMRLARGYYRGVRVSTVALVAIVLISLDNEKAALAQSYSSCGFGTYVDNGDGKGVSCDPRPAWQLHPEAWRFDFYRCSDLAHQRGPWASDHAPTVDQLLAQLGEHQRIAAGAPTTQPDDCYSNYVGPIAEFTSRAVQVGRRLRELIEKASEIYETAKHADETYQLIAHNQAKVTTPFDDLGSVLKEYISNVADERDRIKKLADNLTQTDGTQVDQINAQIQQFESDLQNLRNTGYRVREKLNDAKSRLARTPAPVPKQSARSTPRVANAKPQAPSPRTGSRSPSPAESDSAPVWATPNQFRPIHSPILVKPSEREVPLNEPDDTLLDGHDNSLLDGGRQP